MKTIEDAIEAAARCLSGVGVENPRLESEFLVAACLQMPRTHLVLARGQALPLGQIRTLRGWLREREKRKPLAYVTGEQPFRDLQIKVNSSVLVPRPETELVVEQALRILDQMSKPATVVDVGTGSGNIALSVALHARVQLVIGIDSSARALQVARANQARAPRGAPIRWIKGNLLSPLKNSRLRPDLIVANLPYVRTEEMMALEPELAWEPKAALDGGPDGLRCIKPCIRQAARLLVPSGVLLLEIGADQSREVVHLLNQEKVWDDIRVFRDLGGLPRIVQARGSEL
jgi:release factor glutamine methyltransferase